MIIGIVGFAGSGKGTVGDMLVERHDFTKISFADAVKDAVATIFGWSRHLLEGDTDESRNFREKKDSFWSARFGHDFTPRQALQLMGTEAGRNVFHDNLWVDVVERKIKHKQEWEFENDFVIPDVRFPNEVEAIRKWGGFIVRVVRGEEPEWFNTAFRHNVAGEYEMPVKYPNVHQSEWAWIGQQFDYQIDNQGTVDQLYAEISHMIKVFTGPVQSDNMLVKV